MLNIRTLFCHKIGSALIKSSFLIWCFLCLIRSGDVMSNSNAIQHLGFGGGGVFTSIVEYQNDVYASSDVTGVWKLVEDQWQPLLDGLNNYNITGLFLHSNKLIAVTKDELQVLGTDNVWQALKVSVSTTRNVSAQLNSTSDSGISCIAALEAKLVCIDANMAVTEQALGIDKLHGVFFRPGYNDFILGFYQNILYKIDLASGSHTVVHQFESNIVRIVNLANFDRPVLFTQGGAYKVGTYVEIPFELNGKSIMNVMVAENAAINKNFIATGTTSNAQIYEISYDDSLITLGAKISISYDATLPQRNWRQSLSKPIGIPNVVKDTIWFGDYWGMFAYDPTVSKFKEKSLNATNFVGTELYIDDNTLYVATMDNGLLAMPLEDSGEFTNVFPRTGSDWQLAGHVWSIAKADGVIYATLSPWNLTNDYLISVNSDGEFQHARQISNSSTRYTQKTFWGQSYSRKLVADNALYTYKDGTQGGLFTLAIESAADITSDTSIVESDSELHFSTTNNRVFNALALVGNELVSYHIDDQPTLKFIDVNTGALLDEVNAPSGLWAFGMTYIDSEIYLLGAQGSAVVYKYANGIFSEYLSIPDSSAAYAMTSSFNGDMQIVTSVGWEKKPTGKVLLKRADEAEWIDLTCLMSNRSGAVDVKFDPAENYLYVLQHVGGITRINTEYLQTFSGCTE